MVAFLHQTHSASSTTSTAESGACDTRLMQRLGNVVFCEVGYKGIRESALEDIPLKIRMDGGILSRP